MIPPFLKALTPSHRKKVKDAKRKAKAEAIANLVTEAKSQERPTLPTTKTKLSSFKIKKDDPRNITAFASDRGGKTFVARNIQLPVLGRNDSKDYLNFRTLTITKKCVLSPPDTIRHS